MNFYIAAWWASSSWGFYHLCILVDGIWGVAYYMLYAAVCFMLILLCSTGTQGFIHNGLSLVITKQSFIWFGSTSVDICTALINSW